jgi:hypothetical protein
MSLILFISGILIFLVCYNFLASIYARDFILYAISLSDCNVLIFSYYLLLLS